MNEREIQELCLAVATLQSRLDHSEKERIKLTKRVASLEQESYQSHRSDQDISDSYRRHLKALRGGGESRGGCRPDLRIVS